MLVGTALVLSCYRDRSATDPGARLASAALTFRHAERQERLIGCECHVREDAVGTRSHPEYTGCVVNHSTAAPWAVRFGSTTPPPLQRSAGHPRFTEHGHCGTSRFANIEWCCSLRRSSAHPGLVCWPSWRRRCCSLPPPLRRHQALMRRGQLLAGTGLQTNRGCWYDRISRRQPPTVQDTVA